MLFRSEEHLRAKRLEMVVVVPPPAVIRKVLNIFGIGEVIRLVPTLDEAVHSLRPNQSAVPPSAR